MTVLAGLLVGGVASGCGKTTFTLALMAALRRRGRIVQGFKVGPDYIDPGLHARVTGRPSWNLDGWMGSRDDVVCTFHQALTTAALPAESASTPVSPAVPASFPAPSPDGLPALGIVEGVMGLFDGASGRDDSGSSAEIAAWLKLPVILVVDARGMARSVAALVKGYAGMRADVRIAGVVCTRVNSANHRALLADALTATLPNIPLLGCLPTDPAADLPARHLGLVTAEDAPLSPERLDALATWCADNVDLDAIESLALTAAPPMLTTSLIPPTEQIVAAEPVTMSDLSLPAHQSPAHQSPARRSPVRVALAHDAAFCFVYPALYTSLCAAGAVVVPFSPLTDTDLPACDALWLPGGYPELHAPRLAANTRLRAAILHAVADGLLVHGECGGYIWLTNTLETPEGIFPMLGCLPLAVRMGTRRAALGYRSMHTLADRPFGAAHTVLRGHEFHYAALVGTPSDRYSQPEHLAPLWTSHDRTGKNLGAEGSMIGRVSGSWVHLYPPSAPDALRVFVATARSAHV